jgi:Tfp pilus assembly PilM family ATPase
MATKMVGLDLGAREVRVCEVLVGFSGPELKGVYSAPVSPEPDEDPLRARLRAAVELLGARKLLHEPIACAFPRELTSTLVIEMPFSQPKRVAEVLTFELDDALPFEVEEVVFADQLVGATKAGGVEVFVGYAMRERFEAVFAEMSALGLNPKLLTLSGLTFGQLVALPPAGQATVVLDLGARGAEWAILDASGVRRVHRVNAGGEDLTRAMSELYGIEEGRAEDLKLRDRNVRLLTPEQRASVPEALSAQVGRLQSLLEAALAPILQELARSLASVESALGLEVAELHLVGGGANLGGLAPYLEGRLGVRVVGAPVPPDLEQLTPASERGGAQRLHAAYAMAMTLARRQDRKMANFRAGPFAYQGDSDALRGAFVWLFVSLVLSATLHGARLSAEVDSLGREVEALEEEGRALSRTLMGSELEASILKARVTAQQAVAADVPEVSALDTLGELSEAISREVSVELDTLNVALPPGGRGRIELTGKAKDVGEVSAVQAALEASSCFASKVKKDQVSKSVDGRTKFRITAAASCK